MGSLDDLSREFAREHSERLRFVRRHTPFAALERWQTGYLPVYAAWAWIVVLVFPPLFSYV